MLWTNCEAAIEIARQLKLRNIGGVIIIDFIDMDSRRDQLQLLEHFTTAVRDIRPSADRPAHGAWLVELTCKRQGQNIYELFGRACPSCGGLGHVAVLPGKDMLQPWRQPQDWSVPLHQPVPKCLLRLKPQPATVDVAGAVEAGVLKTQCLFCRIRATQRLRRCPPTTPRKRRRHDATIRSSLPFQ